MGSLIYALCTLTAGACCLLLWRAYSATRVRLLFWAAACFGLQTLNNFLLVLDKVVFPTEISLLTWRYILACAAACLLLYGLIREED